MKDKSGKEIVVGDYIVYGHALGRCAGLQYGKVLEVCLRSRNRWCVPGPDIEKIRVQGASWDWHWNNQPPRLLKPSILNYSDRVLVISEEQVHPQVLNLLKEIKNEN